MCTYIYIYVLYIYMLYIYNMYYIYVYMYYIYILYILYIDIYMYYIYIYMYYIYVIYMYICIIYIYMYYIYICIIYIYYMYICIIYMYYIYYIYVLYICIIYICIIYICINYIYICINYIYIYVCINYIYMYYTYAIYIYMYYTYIYIYIRNVINCNSSQLGTALFQQSKSWPWYFKAMACQDEAAGVYKKLVFTPDGTKLLGGILVGAPRQRLRAGWRLGVWSWNFWLSISMYIFVHIPYWKKCFGARLPTFTNHVGWWNPNGRENQSTILM